MADDLMMYSGVNLNYLFYNMKHKPAVLSASDAVVSFHEKISFGEEYNACFSEIIISIPSQRIKHRTQ